MSIKLSGYEFAGPYRSTSSLEDRSGVYAILTPTNSTYYKVVDAGESAAVKTRVGNHARQPCWQRHANGGDIRIAVYYTPGLQQDGRKVVERKVREQYRPPCGSQ